MSGAESELTFVEQEDLRVADDGASDGNLKGKEF